MPETRARLMAILKARPGITQRALSMRAGVSERTARRHLSALVSSGTVVVRPKGSSRCYELADHAYPGPPPPEFTEGEMEALAVAALAARAVLAPTPLAQALDQAAEKLRNDWLSRAISFEAESEDQIWSFDGAAGGENPPTEPTLFRDLLNAIRHRNPILADYYTASRDTLTQKRRLAPLGFLVRSGAWLVAAADLDAPAQRKQPPPIKDFALAGFRRVERLHTETALTLDQFELSSFVRDRFGALDGAVEVIRLLVEPEAVPAFRRKLYNPTQQIEQVRDDGRAVVSFEAGGIDAVKAWCLSWGPKLRVLEPPDLVRRVAEAHRAAMGRYDDV